MKKVYNSTQNIYKREFVYYHREYVIKALQ